METVSKYNTKNIILISSILLILSIFFQTVTVKNILLSVYSWHLIQPETIRGGIEIVFYGTFFFLSTFYIKNKIVFSTLIICLCLLYLWAHSVLLPVIAVLLYFEIILSFGCWLKKITGISPVYNSQHYLDSLILGLSAWTCLAVLLSVFNFGSLFDLRILTGLVAGISLSRGVNKPLSFWLIQKLGSSGKFEKAGFLSLTTLFLIQFAKTTRALDFDSLLYGLRPEKVLLGAQSFFDHLGFVSFFYYYPKLYEFFLLPVSGFASYSFILCAGIFILLFFCILIFSIGLFLGLTRLWALLLVLLVATLPVVANISSTAKPDIFTNFLMLLAIFRFSQYFSTKQLSHFLIGTSCCLLSLGGKLYALVYIPFLLCSVLLVYFFQSILALKQPDSPHNLPNNARYNSFILFFGLMATVGITLRTYLLTGVPFHPLFTKLWSSLGFTLQYPFTFPAGKGLSWKTSSDFLTIWYQYFISPQELPHVIMLWTGNVSLFLFFTAVILFFLKRDKPLISEKTIRLTYFAALSILVIMAGIFLISFKTFTYQGGDANYFLLPLVLTLICLFVWTTTRIEKNGSTLLKWSLFFSLLCFLLVQSTVMFVSHPSWSWGTGIPHYSLSNSWFKNNNKNGNFRTQLRVHGLLEIEEYIASKGTKRAIGIGNNLLTNRMSWSYESLFHLSLPRNNPSLIADQNTFLHYLQTAKIKYLLIPAYQDEQRKKHEESVGKYYARRFEAVRKIFDKLKGHKNVIIINDRRYLILDISNINLDELVPQT